jgi:hypothetical protein
MATVVHLTAVLSTDGGRNRLDVVQTGIVKSATENLTRDFEGKNQIVKLNCR